MGRRGNGLETWSDCRWAVVFGHGGEDGYALREAGFIENFGCEHPNIIRETKRTDPLSIHLLRSRTQGGYQWTEVIGLHGTGKIDSSSVRIRLDETCRNCRCFSRKRE